jgi:hypothetical protein
MAWFGTGEIRLCSLVSKDHSYKPMVKASGAQRKSDGVVVLPIAGRNPAGGKDPDFGHVGDGGTREGMAGSARSNSPGGRHMTPRQSATLLEPAMGYGQAVKGSAFPCPV